MRDLVRRRRLLVQYRTGLKQSLQNLVTRQTGQAVGSRAVRPLDGEGRAELPGDSTGLPFVATHQGELIEPRDEKTRQFETKVLEHPRLRPAHHCLLTLPDVGVVPAPTMWSN